MTANLDDDIDLYDLCQQLGARNSESYNYDKLMEEMHELGEIILKIRNKRGSPKEPKRQELIDEVGDVMIRIAVVGIMVGEDAVADRMEIKMKRILQQLQEDKYINI